MGNKFSRLKPAERGCRFDKARVSQVVHIFGLPAFLHGTDLSGSGRKAGRCGLALGGIRFEQGIQESRTSLHASKHQAASPAADNLPTTSSAKGDNPATASVSVLGLNPDVHVFWLEASEKGLTGQQSPKKNLHAQSKLRASHRRCERKRLVSKAEKAAGARRRTSTSATRSNRAASDANAKPFTETTRGHSHAARQNITNQCCLYASQPMCDATGAP